MSSPSEAGARSASAPSTGVPSAATTPGATAPSGAPSAGASSAGAPPSGAPSAGAVEALSAEAALAALEQLLSQERAALVGLDGDVIEACAARKLELDRALAAAVAAEPLAAAHEPQLRRVRQLALENQLLLAHARSCVQGVLSLLEPRHAPGYTHPQRAPAAAQPGAAAGATGAAPPPVALNLRT